LRTPLTTWRRLVATTLLTLVSAEEALIRRTRNGRRRFFEAREFPWIAPLEARWRSIRRELDALLPALDLLPNFQDVHALERGLTTDDGWKTFFFYGYGEPHRRNLERCPETARLLEGIPGLTTAFFSILRPGKTLPRHRGPYRGVLRYHLGLRVPIESERCGIRVGGEIAHWREGESLIFDDTHPHDVWNHTAQTRVILFVDFVRPLPLPLNIVNRFLLRRFRRSPSVRGSVARLEQWETAFGDRLDRLRQQAAAAESCETPD
jgi:beta-hydroxylase